MSRNWLGALAGGGRRAQRLVDRGIAAEASGDRAGALHNYRKALLVDPACVPAHMNLGIALQAAGEWAAAIAAHERAIALDPNYFAAHYNLGLVHLLRAQPAQAEASFRGALRLRGNVAEAWVGLSGALEALGRDEDALAALDQAIALRSDYVGALLNSSALLHKMGRFEAALASTERALELEPENHVVHYRLGASLHELGRLAEAETRYRQALAFRPDYAEAKAGLALVLQAQDRSAEGIELLFELVAGQPADARWRTLLAESMLYMTVVNPGHRERTILLSLCTDDGIPMQSLTPSIIALTKRSEGYRIVQESTRRGDDPFAALYPAVADLLGDPLLLAALPRMPIAEVAMEEVLAYVRRCIVLRLPPAPGLVGADAQVPWPFLCALARQCFFSGYVFFAEADELERVTAVRQALENALRGMPTSPRALEPSLLVASLYGSLGSLQGCERLLEWPADDWSEAFRPIVLEQLDNPRRERALANRLTSLTAIDDPTSQAVRTQYEVNPYPRWVSVSSPGADTLEKLSARLRPGRPIGRHARPVPILVAGCGTGRHPIMLARVHPDGAILAVDLSLASLGYAARMTERLGISNITYRQADILKLGSLEQRFALIECCGVLHHLDDPVAGWRVLVGLLEVDGMMRIALYSEKARRAVRAARQFIQTSNFALNADGIRHCRRAITRLPEGDAIRGVMTFIDFYTLDECRDLMMHVREHQFTLPRIADCLDQLGLQFLGMECPAATRSRFRQMFPESAAGTDLMAWHEFEEAQPDSFKTMYLFWCCKKSSGPQSAA